MTIHQWGWVRVVVWHLMGFSLCYRVGVTRIMIPVVNDHAILKPSMLMNRVMYNFATIGKHVIRKAFRSIKSKLHGVHSWAFL